MMLAIFIFLLSILLLTVNVRFSLISSKDTLKTYLKIGLIPLLIPHQKLIKKLIKKEMAKSNQEKKEDLIKAMNSRSLIYNLLSHSVLDKMYIAKSSIVELKDEPIQNGLYLITAYQIRGLLYSLFRFVQTEDIRLTYNRHYENIDYYFESHISVISLIWVAIISLF